MTVWTRPALRHILVLGFALPASLAACGEDEAGIPDAASENDASDDDPDAADGDAANNPDAGGVGEPCGGLPGLTCEGDLWCDYGNNICGGDDSQGVCTERPTTCTEEIDPVCGCDGEIYDNPCLAEMAGTDVSNLGGCTAPLDTFRCGPRFCAHATEYCRVYVSDVAGFPDEYECGLMPNGCGNDPDCACVAAETCGDWCEEPVDDELVLTCPGG